VAALSTRERSGALVTVSIAAGPFSSGEITAASVGVVDAGITAADALVVPASWATRSRKAGTPVALTEPVAAVTRLALSTMRILPASRTTPPGSAEAKLRDWISALE
jgi:hypothetical protein